MRLRAYLLWVPLIALSLACGRGENYVDATANDAMSGSVESATDTYRIVDPDIAAVKGNFALLRQGRSVHLVTADDFEDLYPTLEGKDFSLLVRKWPREYPHFRLHGVEVGGETIETNWVLGESRMPLLIDKQLYDISLFDPIDITPWEETAPSLSLVDEKVWIPVTIEWSVRELTEEEKIARKEAELALSIPEETAEEGEEALADTLGEPFSDTLAAGVEEEEGKEKFDARGLLYPRERKIEEPTERDVFVITAAGRRFELIDFDEDGVKLLLIDMMKQGKTFPVGGYIVDVYPRRQQQEIGMTGKFQLAVFEYAGKYCMIR
ncbi:MAG: hypothetical protein JW958_14790 [Candidatus Eisenbacteria bacterium]|nr:hypothetical protein [Candidatus Eisenbacteria bacterium]